MALLAPSGRRAVLTPAGELLLNQVKPLLQAFAYVETHAATLRNGARTRLGYGGRQYFPAPAAVRDFTPVSAALSADPVRLTEVLENRMTSAARTEADVMVLTRRRDITGRGEWLMNIDFIAVAHRDHPLAALDGPLEDSALAPWPLVRIADQGGDSRAARRPDLLHH